MSANLPNSSAFQNTNTEALARLAQDGLVDIIRARVCSSTQIKAQQILDMVITWAALESMTARLAVVNASDTDIKVLQFAMSQSETASKAELSEYSDTNVKFHQSILDLSGCELRTTADDLFAHMYAVRQRALSEGDRASRSVADHGDYRGA